MSGLGWFLLGMGAGFYLGGFIATLMVANDKKGPFDD